MPWIRQYIAPETACLIEQTDLHTGEVITFTVYHTYIDDDFTQPSPYLFTLDREERWSCEFDIRKWPTYNSDLTPRQVMQSAVDLGWVELDDISFWMLVDRKPGPWEVDAVTR